MWARRDHPVEYPSPLPGLALFYGWLGARLALHPPQQCSAAFNNLALPPLPNTHASSTITAPAGGQGKAVLICITRVNEGGMVVGEMGKGMEGERERAEEGEECGRFDIRVEESREIRRLAAPLDFLPFFGVQSSTRYLCADTGWVSCTFRLVLPILLGCFFGKYHHPHQYYSAASSSGLLGAEVRRLPTIASTSSRQPKPIAAPLSANPCTATGSRPASDDLDTLLLESANGSPCPSTHSHVQPHPHAHGSHSSSSQHAQSSLEWSWERGGIDVSGGNHGGHGTPQRAGSADTRQGEQGGVQPVCAVITRIVGGTAAGSVAGRRLLRAWLELGEHAGCPSFTWESWFTSSAASGPACMQ
ncbi:hypothetical protein B0H14DRAFT_2573917, partial [Mycena olivaceomarginata]